MGRRCPCLCGCGAPVCVLQRSSTGSKGVLRPPLCSPFPNTSNGVRGQSKIGGCPLGLAGLYLENDMKKLNSRGDSPPEQTRTPRRRQRRPGARGRASARARARAPAAAELARAWAWPAAAASRVRSRGLRTAAVGGATGRSGHFPLSCARRRRVPRRGWGLGGGGRRRRGEHGSPAPHTLLPTSGTLARSGSRRRPARLRP